MEKGEEGGLVSLFVRGVGEFVKRVRVRKAKRGRGGEACGRRDGEETRKRE